MREKQIQKHMTNCPQVHFAFRLPPVALDSGEWCAETPHPQGCVTGNPTGRQSQGFGSLTGAAFEGISGQSERGEIMPFGDRTIRLKGIPNQGVPFCPLMPAKHRHTPDTPGDKRQWGEGRGSKGKATSLLKGKLASPGLEARSGCPWLPRNPRGFWEAGRRARRSPGLASPGASPRSLL